MVTDQAAYLYGDYNLDPNWIPSAILSDTMSVLSNAWRDDNYSTQRRQEHPTGVRHDPAGRVPDRHRPKPATTTVSRSGALNNYPRFHGGLGERARTLNSADFLRQSLPSAPQRVRILHQPLPATGA